MPPPAPVLGLSLRRFAPGQRMPRHVDGVSRISLVLDGRLRERAGSAEVEAGAGSVAFKPGDVEHDDTFGPAGAQLWSIACDDGWLRAAGIAIGPWQWWCHAGLQRNALRLFLLARAEGADHPEVADRLVEWLALAQSMEALQGRSANARCRAPGWLRGVHQRLHDEPAVGLSRLAAGAGVHPVHLARRFRRHFGCSVSDYARARRLADAMAAIAQGHSLAAAAAAAGYVDQAHLGRGFRQQLGLTPGRVRALLGEVGAR